jgi:hypothetical protein
MQALSTENNAHVRLKSLPHTAPHKNRSVAHKIDLVTSYCFTSRSRIGLRAERDLYRATPAESRGPGFPGLIWSSVPSVTSDVTQGDVEDIL